MAKPVPYQAIYLWTCPECGATWQSRHRPREGSQLVCAAQAEQVIANRHEPGVPYRGCGSMSVSAGRRKGLAPTLTF
jgi:hypothetical protein